MTKILRLFGLFFAAMLVATNFSSVPAMASANTVSALASSLVVMPKISISLPSQTEEWGGIPVTVKSSLPYNTTAIIAVRWVIEGTTVGYSVPVKLGAHGETTIKIAARSGTLLLFVTSINDEVAEPSSGLLIHADCAKYAFCTFEGKQI